MSLNTFSLHFTREGLPEFCGPDELANAIIAVRNSTAEQHGCRTWCSTISDDGIRRLIRMAFYTSFAAEEGRYPRFRLTIADTAPSTDGSFVAATFDVPISSVESLRRLAPAASDTDIALIVTEKIVSENSTELWCGGLQIVGVTQLGIQIGQPVFSGVQIGNPTFSVRIDGPGKLRVTEFGYCTLLLDRGQIHEVVDYNHVPEIRKYWEELSARILADVDATETTQATKTAVDKGSLAEALQQVWSEVLSTVVDQLHGGAFVILPVEGDSARPQDFNIEPKYPTQMRFGERIREFWLSCVDVGMRSADSKERKRAENKWKLHHSVVYTQARILAGLSSVDGCVVLDRNLNTLGFGGEIRIDDSKDEQAPRQLHSRASNEAMSEYEMRQMGTRHRSAYRLAKVHAGTIVFVISQDGDLRIFCSDENNVYGYERLHAWVHDHESQ